jgi:putative hydrolase
MGHSDDALVRHPPTMPLVAGSDPSPFSDDEGGDPFGGVPFLGDLMKMLGAQGGFRWEQAMQIAFQLATEGRSEPNPDPLERIALEQLARVAELHVTQLTGLPTSRTGRPITVVPVNRTVWLQRAAGVYRPLLEQVSQSLAARPAAHEGGSGDPFGDPAAEADPMYAMWAQMADAMAPAMLAMAAGSMLANLARRSFGEYDLPIPRPPQDELVLVSPNLAAFGDEWSLAADDLRLWVCLHEVAHHTILGVPHIGDELRAILAEHAAGFTPDARGLSERLGDVRLDDPSSMASLQETFADPQVILGAMRSDAQRALLPRLEALTATVIGLVDWIMDTAGSALIPSYAQITEALRRRRVGADAGDRFIEQLLGLELTPATCDRGETFVAGIIERAGVQGLEPLWSDPKALPTPAEIDAPGLWLARIELPTE